MNGKRQLGSLVKYVCKLRRTKAAFSDLRPGAATATLANETNEAMISLVNCMMVREFLKRMDEETFAR